MVARESIAHNDDKIQQKPSIDDAIVFLYRSTKNGLTVTGALNRAWSDVYSQIAGTGNRQGDPPITHIWKNKNKQRFNNNYVWINEKLEYTSDDTAHTKNKDNT